MRGVIPVLTDTDVEAVSTMSDLVRVCAAAVDADAAGRLAAPARHSVDLGGGRLVFTAGGNDTAVGFRAYETFPTSKQDQVVAVWDPRSGELEGVVVGKLLGAMRTGALGGVAIDRLAAPGAGSCALIGTGLQARTQLLACAAVRSLSEVRVFSREEANRERFAATMATEIKVEIKAMRSAAAAVDGAEIVVLATTATTPVIDSAWLSDGVHLSTVGPKSAGRHELPVDVVEHAWMIATDSPQQIASQGEQHFLFNSSAWKRVGHLGNVDSDRERRGSTVFLSAGLAGTEVLVASELLRSYPPIG